MPTNPREDVIAVLRQFVHGEISSSELLQYVRRRDHFELDELLESIQLRTADYARIALSEAQLAHRIERYLGKEIQLQEFSEWVYQIHRIVSSGEHQAAPVYSREIETALMLLALLVDLDITEGPRLTRRLTGLMLNALRRGRPTPTRFILEKMFKNKKCVHLATRNSGASPDRPWQQNQWVEVLLLNRPLHPRATVAEDHGWFISLVVCTQEYWVEGAPAEGWSHPENDRVRELREEFPHLDFDSHSPQYYFDPEGLVEVVLAVDEIGAPEVELGVRLFCLVNQVRGCYLNGNHIYPAEEDR